MNPSPLRGQLSRSMNPLYTMCMPSMNRKLENSQRGNWSKPMPENLSIYPQRMNPSPLRGQLSRSMNPLCMTCMPSMNQKLGKNQQSSLCKSRLRLSSRSY